MDKRAVSSKDRVKANVLVLCDDDQDISVNEVKILQERMTCHINQVAWNQGKTTFSVVSLENKVPFSGADLWVLGHGDETTIGNETLAAHTGLTPAALVLAIDHLYWQHNIKLNHIILAGCGKSFYSHPKYGNSLCDEISKFMKKNPKDQKIKPEKVYAATKALDMGAGLTKSSDDYDVLAITYH